MKPERSGLYGILRLSSMYGIIQKVIGSTRGVRVFVDEYLRSFSGARILDIGSGTGLIVPRLGDVSYLGIEPNSTYVHDFNRRFATDKIRMVNGTTESIKVEPNSFDIVLISAVLHHVDDQQARSILRYAHSALSASGRIVVLDCVLHSGQGLISRQLVKSDRGRYVRWEEDYKALFSGVGLVPTFAVRTDLNRFPYSHIITVATPN